MGVLEKHPWDISWITKSICESFLMMGNLNINLLKYQSHSETNGFINFMVSHYLLPHILHQTSVTDHSATITDN